MSVDRSQPAQVLRVAMRAGVNLLMSGAQTDDVEEAITTVASAYGLSSVQAAVTFSTISVSHDDPDATGPTTLLHLVKDRTSDFNRLAGAASIVRGINEKELDLSAAERAFDELEQAPPATNRLVMFVAPGISAAASTLVFNGSPADAAATFGIALVVQPALAALDRSTFPPFFRLVFGAFASSILVVLLVQIGLPIVGGLVLAGSLLRFLPGYALVSGFRDLIGQSVISGTARLAEALLLGAGVAGGTAAAIAVASFFGVSLSLISIGNADWGLVVSVVAAFVAVLTFAIRLGVPTRATVGAAALGAAALLLYKVLVTIGPGVDPALATLTAAVGVGVVGRLLARRTQAPAALWVVPAVLMLLPGLQLVSAMLARTNQERVEGLIAAAGTAFVLGVGVASGDIIFSTARQLRRTVVNPAVDAMAGGVDVFVVTPVGQVAERAAERLGRHKDDPQDGPTP